MCSLLGFPAPPPPGYVTICEQHAELISGTKDDVQYQKYVQNLQYPDVNIAQELMRPSMSRESARSAFLEHGDTPNKRLWRAWYEHGITGVLEELANGSGVKENRLSWLASTACFVLGVVRWTTSLHCSLFPHLAMSSDNLTAEFSSNANWHDAYIRCFAWHPHTEKFAVALRDDSIKIYSLRKNSIVPILKHKQQKGIADLQWKPASASVLAVACQSCILIWNVDPTSLATRPSTSCAQVLSQSGHCPVTSLAWCPQGGLLLSASPTHSTMMAWDVAMESCTPLQRVGGGGVSLLRWSPDGSKVLAACPSSTFRVWETRKWTCEQWTKLAGRCQAACWNPDGSALLFTTMDEPTIYCLTFTKDPDETKPVIGGSKVAISSVNLTPCELQTEEGTVCVGGFIQSMAWDPRGERLAVQFKGVSPELIAVFQTRMEPALEVIPCGFVCGQDGELPHLISFKPHFEGGALLTVVWSSGQIGYIPLYFVPRQSLQHNQLLYQTSGNGYLQGATLYSEPM